MTRFVDVDLTTLQMPDVVEEIDFEAILVELKADLVARLAAAGVEYDVQNLESDPAVKNLEVTDYRETLIRARVNSAARAVMLAYAQDADLDNLGVYYGVQRRLVAAATLTTPAVYEDNELLRRRIQLAPEAFSSCGTEGSYEFFTLGVDPSIKDVALIDPQPGSGQVHVVPLTNVGNGLPSGSLLERVRSRLKEKKLKQLTDILTVRAPSLNAYTVSASLEIAEGPDPNVVLAAARASLTLYCSARHRVGFPVRRNGIIAALGVAGVENITVTSPAADVLVNRDGVAYATSISVEAA